MEVYFSGTGNTKKLQKSFRKNYRQIFWKLYRRKHIQVKISIIMIDLDIQGGYRFDANADNTDIQKGIEGLTK